MTGESISFQFEDTSSSGPETDPTPGRKPRGRPRGSTNKPKAPAQRKSSLQGELEANLLMLTGMSGQLWTMKDPTCGPVLVAQSAEIAASLAEICVAYPNLAAKLVAVTSFGQYMRLFMAASPVVQTVMQHHLMADQNRQNGAEVNGGPIPFPT